MSQLLVLRTNALSLKFRIMGEAYTHYDADHLSELKAGGEEHSSIINIFKAANPTIFSYWEVLSRTNYRNKAYRDFNGNSLARWGALTHPNQKGSIVYAQTDSSFSNKSQLYLSVYSNGNPRDRFHKTAYDHVLSMRFTQTPTQMEMTGARIISPSQEKGEGRIKNTSKMPNTRLAAIRTMLFAHECYKKIESPQGVQWDKDIRRFESMDETDAHTELNNTFGDLVLN